MTSAIYDTRSDLPALSEELDEAFIRQTGEQLKYLRSQGAPRYSWVFDEGSFLKNNVKLELLSNDSSGFQLSFWSRTSSRNDFVNTGSPLCSFDINDSNYVSTIKDLSSYNRTLVLNEKNVVESIPRTPFEIDSDENPGMLKFDARIKNPVGFGTFGPGTYGISDSIVNRNILKSNQALLPFDSEFKNFSIGFWLDPQLRSLKAEPQTVSAGDGIETSRLPDIFRTFVLNDDGNMTILQYEDSVENCGALKIDREKVIFQNGTYNIDAYANQPNLDFHWFTYDGYDFVYYDKLTEAGRDSGYTMLFDEERSFNSGDLDINKFFLDKDAGFQIKTRFPYSTSGGAQQNGVLFTLGDQPNRTRIELVTGTSTGDTLKFEAGNISETTTDFPTQYNQVGFAPGPDHVVSWDYNVKTGAIRLWIDKKLVINYTGNPSVSWIGKKWADHGVNNNISAINEIAPITQNSIVEINSTYGLAWNFGYGSANLRSQPMTKVDERGNIRWSPTFNLDCGFNTTADKNRGPGTPTGRGFTTFSIGASGASTPGPVIPINQSKIYYFEVITPAFTSPISENYYYNITLQDAGWSGSETEGVLVPHSSTYGRGKNNNDILFNVLQEAYGDQARWFKDGIRHSASNGKFANRIHEDVYLRKNFGDVHSFFIDTTVSGGRGFYLRNGERVDTKYDLEYHNSPAGGGLILAFNGRMLRGNRENLLQITFNRDDWVYDPLTLYNIYKAYLSEYPTIKSNDVLQTNDNIQDWPGTPYEHKLRYFNGTFKNYKNQTLKIGSDKKPLNGSAETGLSYAQSYIAKTGGTIYNISNSTDLRNYMGQAATSFIPSNSSGTSQENLINAAVGFSRPDGNAYVLEPGTYIIDGFRQSVASNNCSLFGIFNGLICGNTTNPSDVVIKFNHDLTAQGISTLDRNIFGTASDPNTQLAFLKVDVGKDALPSSNQLKVFNAGGGKAYKCIFDFESVRFPILYTSRAGSVPENGYAKILEDCFFLLNTNPDIASVSSFDPILDVTNKQNNLHLINNTFTREINQFASTGTVSGEYRYKEYGENKQFLLDFDSSTNTVEGSYLYGKMKNFSLHSDAFDGVYSEPINKSHFTQRVALPNAGVPRTQLFISSENKYRSLLRLDDNGDLFYRDKIVDSGFGYDQTRRSNFKSSVEDKWVFNTLKYDKNANTIKIKMRSTEAGVSDSYVINNAFDSFSLGQHNLKICGSDSFNFSSDSFDVVTTAPLHGDGSKQIHELIFSTDSIYHSAQNIDVSLIPTVAQQRDSVDEIFMCDSQVIESKDDTQLFGNLIQGDTTKTRIEAPYAVGTLRWYGIGLLKLDSNGGARLENKDYKKLETVLSDGSVTETDHHTEVFATYRDSTYTNENVGPPLNALIKFPSIDDNDKSIKWNVSDIVQIDKRITVAHDSSSTNFLVKQFNKNSIYGVDREASLLFSCSMADSLDSSDPEFLIRDEYDNIRKPSYSLSYSRFFTTFVNHHGGDFFHQVGEIVPVDSSLNQSHFTFIEDSSNRVAYYINAGALPA